jgi:membrane protein DedA with SNARE-associated domain
MEPEVKAFLKRVALTIFAAFIWFVLNCTLGIMYQFAFFEKGIHWSNIIFYTWCIASLVMLIIFYVRLWKNTLQK